MPAAKQPYPTDLAGWQSFTFRQSDVPIQSVADDMGTNLGRDKGNFCLKLAGEKGRWVLCNAETKIPVRLSFALPWNWSTDLNTGNFVPKVPGIEGEPRKGFFSTPGNACAITYSFDTSDDNLVHRHLRAIDRWVARHNPEFNRTGKRREEFQDPERPFALSRLAMVCRIFEKRSRSNVDPSGKYTVPYPVHDTIKDVTFPATDWIPNPDRTRLSELVDGEVRPLWNSDWPTMDKGDPSWFAFKLFYIEKRDTWMTECVPVDIVRVSRQHFGQNADDYAFADSYEPLEGWTQTPPSQDACEAQADITDTPMDMEGSVGSIPPFQDLALSKMLRDEQEPWTEISMEEGSDVQGIAEKLRDAMEIVNPELDRVVQSGGTLDTTPLPGKDGRIPRKYGVKRR